MLFEEKKIIFFCQKCTKNYFNFCMHKVFGVTIMNAYSNHCLSNRKYAYCYTFSFSLSEFNDT